MHSNTAYLWRFLLPGYVATVAIEIPFLLLFLSTRHSINQRIWAGLWLTACTYPIVVLVLPVAMYNAYLWQYLTVAETFAPVAECGLFWLVWIQAKPHNVSATVHDFIAVSVANLASFGVGEWFYWWNQS